VLTKDEPKRTAIYCLCGTYIATVILFFRLKLGNPGHQNKSDDFKEFVLKLFEEKRKIDEWHSKHLGSDHLGYSKSHDFEKENFLENGCPQCLEMKH